MGNAVLSILWPRSLGRRAFVLAIAVAVMYSLLSLLFLQSSGGASKQAFCADVASDSGRGRERATLMMVTKNEEIRQAMGAMRSVEDRFNGRYHYPWTFLSYEKFSSDFKKYTRGLASGPVEYAVIPKKEWAVPKNINQTTMRAKMNELAGLPFGDSQLYRQQCRFQSGFFYDQPVMAKYDWYWRIEPSIKLLCNVDMDPFSYLIQHNQTYGFVITMREFEAFIPSLWDRVKEFASSHPEHVAADNSVPWLIDLPEGSKNETDLLRDMSGASHTVPTFSRFNRCHFWSNFEIASLAFFRSPAYRAYFDYLDQKGGFFLERWGDAPVHSMALAFMLPRTKIHHFEDIGYEHGDISRCPADDKTYIENRCLCDRRHSYDNHRDSCTPQWKEFVR